MSLILKLLEKVHSDAFLYSLLKLRRKCSILIIPPKNVESIEYFKSR